MSIARKIIEGGAGGGGSGEPGGYVDDVFSTYLYEGTGAPKDIVNGIPLGDSGTAGSVSFDGNGDYLETPDDSAFAIGTRDFTIEAWVYPRGRGDSYARVMQGGKYGNGVWNTSDSWGLMDRHNVAPTKFAFAAYNISGNSLILTSTSDVVDYEWTHIAVTRQGTTLRLFFNGVLEDTYTSSAALTTSSTVGVFVQHPMEQANNLISNARIVNGTALYTQDFTVPTSALTAVTNTALLTCQGDDPFVDNSIHSHAITKHGDVFAVSSGPWAPTSEGKGGLVWIKCRNQAVTHQLVDTERGQAEYLASQSTSPSINDATSRLTSFNSDGFSLGTGGEVNNSTRTYASWTWAKQEGFFDVVTYTGNGVAGREIAHNLGSEPGMIIVKQINNDSYWRVYHRSLGATKNLVLNLTNAEETNTLIWNDTAPTDSVFTLGSSSNVNSSDAGYDEYVAYIFAHDAPMFGTNGNESIIKCGTFNAANYNVETDFGWEPQWILIKSSPGTSDWRIIDNMRGSTDSLQATLRANLTDAELSIGTLVEFTPRGVIQKVAYSQEYIYMAIRRPMKPAEEFEPDELFALDVTANASPTAVAGFPVDMAWLKDASRVSDSTLTSRLISANYLVTNSSQEMKTSNSLTFDFQDGFGKSTWSSYPYNSWMFRRAPGFFDVLTYTGDGEEGREIPHNLGSVPGMIIVKNTSKDAWWQVYHKNLSDNGTYQYNLYLNTDGAEDSGYAFFKASDQTSTNIKINRGNGINIAGDTYIAYLFASVPGISKVGSYTGTGALQDIDCGFTNGSRFVLVKRADDTGDWQYWDTLRGIVSGASPYLALNNADAQADGYRVYPLAEGFQISDDPRVNASGGEYIYMAIA